MHTVTISPKYQIVIPKTVRKALHIRPGQKMMVVEYQGRIQLIPERDIAELRGFLKGINTEFEREGPAPSHLCHTPACPTVCRHQEK